MKTYRATFPFIDDMGSVNSMIVKETTMETKEEHALWYLNNMRDHDGLPHLDSLPDGVKFEPVQSSKPYQPKTGQKCGCRPGQQRDNCPTCEGTGMVVDFVAIRARRMQS